MSEYQYYEWQAVDRLLTEAEQKAVHNLSSHIEVSSSRTVVTYSYGDFKHDTRTVLARFFDAHVYLANWGMREGRVSVEDGVQGWGFQSPRFSRSAHDAHKIRTPARYQPITCWSLTGIEDRGGEGWYNTNQ